MLGLKFMNAAKKMKSNSLYIKPAYSFVIAEGNKTIPPVNKSCVNNRGKTHKFHFTTIFPDYHTKDVNECARAIFIDC